MSARQEFIEKYGAYMEFIYLYLNGEMRHMESVFSVKAHQFLFIVQFLKEKNSVETIKSDNTKKYF